MEKPKPDDENARKPDSAQSDAKRRDRDHHAPVVTPLDESKAIVDGIEVNET